MVFPFNKTMQLKITLHRRYQILFLSHYWLSLVHAMQWSVLLQNSFTFWLFKPSSASVKPGLSPFILRTTTTNDFCAKFLKIALQCLASTKRSHILKQTCNWKMQVCLSMCELLMDTKYWRVKCVKKCYEGC